MSAKANDKLADARKAQATHDAANALPTEEERDAAKIAAFSWTTPWDHLHVALDEVKRLQDQMAEVSTAFRNGSVGGDFDTLHSYVESALAEVEVAPRPEVPNPITIVYTRYAVRFVDSTGKEFQPTLVSAIEVIRVMSEYAKELAHELFQREWIARDAAGQPAKTSLLHDIAARISTSVPNPWADQDQDILRRMATHGEAVWAAGEVQAAKERQQR